MHHVIFVEFLEQTLVLVDHQDLKLELLLVDVTVKHHGLEQVRVSVNICKQVLTRLGVPVDVILIGQQVAELQVLVLIVVIGQSVVLVDQDKAAQE